MMNLQPRRDDSSRSSSVTSRETISGDEPSSASSTARAAGRCLPQLPASRRVRSLTTAMWATLRCVPCCGTSWCHAMRHASSAAHFLRDLRLIDLPHPCSPLPLLGITGSRPCRRPRGLQRVPRPAPAPAAHIRHRLRKAARRPQERVQASRAADTGQRPVGGWRASAGPHGPWHEKLKRLAASPRT